MLLFRRWWTWLFIPRVPDAVQRPSRCSAEPGPTLWMHGPRISSASLRAAQHPGHEHLLPTRPERIAGLYGSLLIAGHEPLLALRGGAVGEGVRHHPARRLAL